MSHSIGSMVGTLYRELNQIYTTGSALLYEGYKALPTFQKISQTVSRTLEQCKDYIPEPDDLKTKGFVYDFASGLVSSTALSWIKRTPNTTSN